MKVCSKAWGKLWHQLEEGSKQSWVRSWLDTESKRLEEGQHKVNAAKKTCWWIMTCTCWLGCVWGDTLNDAFMIQWEVLFTFKHKDLKDLMRHVCCETLSQSHGWQVYSGTDSCTVAARHQLLLEFTCAWLHIYANTLWARHVAGHWWSETTANGKFFWVFGCYSFNTFIYCVDSNSPAACDSLIQLG